MKRIFADWRRTFRMGVVAWMLRLAIRISPNGISRLLLYFTLKSYLDMTVVELEANIRRIEEFRARSNGYDMHHPVP